MDELRDTAPICPHCGKPMRLTRTVPGIGGLPELYTYSCRESGASVTQAGEPGERGATS
jgi:hypothetical protein